MSRRTEWIGAIVAGASCAALALPAAAHDEPVVGVLGGAGAGALIAGPPGAVAGAIIGAIAGAAIAHDTDHGHHARHHHRHYGAAPVYRERVRYAEPGHIAYRERVRYVETTRYAGNGSTTYHCEPEATYRPKVVHREDRVVTRTVAAKPKMKKVCRYVPVRNTTSASIATRPVS